MSKMMTKESTKLNLRASSQRLFIKEFTEDGTFEGYGSVFGVKDTYAEIVAAGAFDASLSEHRKEGTFPAMLWQHDPSKPIGVYTEMREDEKGLFVRGKLLLDTQLGKEAHVLLKAGALNGLSIGFMPVKSSKDDENGVRTLTEIDLWEVSLVTFPANDKSRVEGVKGALANISKLSGVERFLCDTGGYSRSQATAIVALTLGIARRHRDDVATKSDISSSGKRLLDLLS